MSRSRQGRPRRARHSQQAPGAPVPPAALHRVPSPARFRSRHRHHDLGRALAEAGVVAIVPDLPNVMDLWGNGDAVAELTARVEKGAFGFPPVPRSRIVLPGTSAGGA